MSQKKKAVLLVLSLVLLIVAFVIKPMLSENKKADMDIEGTDIDREEKIKIEGTDIDREEKIKIEGTDIDREEKIKIEGTDIDGENINSEILKENELTMVNIWGTFCKACIEEMPELEGLSKELKKEGIGLVGVVLDGGDSEENMKLAKTILEKNDITFKNIIPSKDMQDKCLKDLMGFPTTVFLDKEGNIVGEPVLGSVGKETFKKTALERLDSLRKGK